MQKIDKNKTQMAPEMAPKIEYSNRAIENLNLKKYQKFLKADQVEIRFSENSSYNIKGCFLRVNIKTKSKKFYLRYVHKGIRKKYFLGTYSSDYKVKENAKKLSILREHCVKKGAWTRTPEDYYRNQTVSDKENSRSALTLGEVIVELVKAEFPRAHITGTLSAYSQRAHCRYAFGYNKRISFLTWYDDLNGHGHTQLKEDSGFVSLDDLFKKYPPGKGVEDSKKPGEISIYDHPISSIYVDELVPGDVEEYINEVKRAYGTKRHIKILFAKIWDFARSKRFLGANPIQEITKGIRIVRDENEPENFRTRYNDFVYTLDELEKLYRALVSLREQLPFAAEGCMMLMFTGMRTPSVLKLTYDMIQKSDVGYDVIKVSRTALKGRAQYGQKDESYDITEPVQEVLEMLSEQRKKDVHQCYKYTNYLFPSRRADRDKMMDTSSDYRFSHEARLKELALHRCFWKAKVIAGVSGGALKSLRKTFDVLADTITKGDWRLTKGVTKRKSREIRDKHYLKARPEEIKKVADKIGQVLNFDRTKKKIS